MLARAKDAGVDPAYVYGLIRQESRFVMDAKSHVGASGLMQVMPATGQRYGLVDDRYGPITRKLSDAGTIVLGGGGLVGDQQGRAGGQQAGQPGMTHLMAARAV